MKPYTQKKLGGEIFKYVGFRYGKRDAQKAAKEMRAKGKKVRVLGPVKTKHGVAYTLWARRA